MAKTVLELTPEELRRYKLAGKLEVPPDTGRWERAWKVARSAAKLLRRRFGADGNVFFPEDIDQIIVLGSVYFETVAVDIGNKQFLALDHHIRNAFTVNHV